MHFQGLNQHRKITELSLDAQRKYAIVLMALAILCFVGLSFAFISHSWWEDADISFRYARNWSENKGLVYNTGEYVEGYSNLLWTVLHGLLYMSGLSMYGANIALVLLCALLTGIALAGTALSLYGHRPLLGLLPLSALLFATDLTASYGNGLEGPCTTMAVALIVCGAARNHLGILGAGVTVMLLNRFDGIIYLPLVICWATYACHTGHVKVRHLGYLVGICFFVLIALTVFRLAYYGDFMPNSIRAKSQSISLEHLRFDWPGTRYLFLYAISMGPPLFVLAGAAIFISRRRDFNWLLAALLAFNSGLLWVAGGDWMAHHRLLVPFFPLILLLAASTLDHAWGHRGRMGATLAIIYMASMFFCFHPGLIWDQLKHIQDEPFPKHFFNRHIDKVPISVSNNIKNTDFHLPDDSVVIEWGGVQSWTFWNAHVIEMWGLTDRELVLDRGPYAKRMAAAGVQNWPGIFEKEPPYFSFTWGWEYKTPFLWFDSIVEIPGLEKAFEDYLIAKKRPFNSASATVNQLAVHKDRELLALFLLDYGSIIPGDDYPLDFEGIELFPPPSEHTTGPGYDRANHFLTPWHRCSWRSTTQSPVRDEWVAWNTSIDKVSSRLPYDAGYTTYWKGTEGDTALAFLFGSTEPEETQITFSVRANGHKRPVATRVLPPSTEPGILQLAHVFIPTAHFCGPADVVLEIQGGNDGELLVAGYRWTNGPPPSFPRNLEIPENGSVGGMTTLYVALARQQDNDGDALSSEAWIEKAIAWPGITDSGTAELAAYLVEHNQLELARAVCLDAAIEHPWGPNICAWLLRAHQEMGTPAKALQDFSTLTSVHPDAFAPQLFSSIAFEWAGCKKEAQHTRRNAFALLPKDYRLQDDVAELVLATGKTLGRFGFSELAKDVLRHLIFTKPGPHPAYARLTDLYAERQDWPGMVQEWRQLLAEAPHNRTIDVHYKRTATYAGGRLAKEGLLSLEQKRYEEAARLFRMADDAAPWDISHRMNLGRIYDLLGDYAAAENEYRQVLLNAPESPVTAARLNALFKQQNMDEEGLVFWLSLADFYPDSAIATLYIGSTFERMGCLTNARTYYARALAIQNDLPAGLYRMGALNIQEGKMNEGRTQIRNALYLNPDLAGEIAKRLTNLATKFFDSGDYEKAKKLYRLSHSISPKDLWALLYLGEISDLQGKPNVALDLYRQVLLEAPESPVTASKADIIFERLDDSEYALEFWTDLERTHPQAIIPRLHLGIAYEREGDYDKARNVYTATLQEHPDSADILLRLAILDIRGNDMPTGTKNLLHVLALKPALFRDATEDLMNIAAGRHFSEDYDEAVQLYILAHILAPDDLWALVRLGETYELLSKTAEAMETYQQVLTKAPESPVAAAKLDALFNVSPDINDRYNFWSALVDKHPKAIIPKRYLGATLESQGDIEGAYLVYKDALTAGPECEETRRVLNERLCELTQGTSTPDEARPIWDNDPKNVQRGH